MNNKIKDLLEVIGIAYVESIQAELIRIGLQDSNIYDSISYTVSDKGVIINIPEYSTFIESGRKPLSKLPPISNLLRWMKLKRIAPGNENKIVWAIAKSIAKKGIKPRPFIERAVKNAEESIEGFMIGVSELIDIEIKKILSNG
jgi:hypothetical protein